MKYVIYGIRYYSLEFIIINTEDDLDDLYVYLHMFFRIE